MRGDTNGHSTWMAIWKRVYKMTTRLHHNKINTWDQFITSKFWQAKNEYIPLRDTSRILLNLDIFKKFVQTQIDHSCSS